MGDNLDWTMLFHRHDAFSLGLITHFTWIMFWFRCHFGWFISYFFEDHASSTKQTKFKINKSCSDCQSRRSRIIKSPLMDIVRQENINKMQLREGSGDDGDNLHRYMSFWIILSVLFFSPLRCRLFLRRFWSITVPSRIVCVYDHRIPDKLRLKSAWNHRSILLEFGHWRITQGLPLRAYPH